MIFHNIHSGHSNKVLSHNIIQKMSNSEIAKLPKSELLSIFMTKHESLESNLKDAIIRYIFEQDMNGEKLFNLQRGQLSDQFAGHYPNSKMMKEVANNVWNTFDILTSIESVKSWR